MGVLGALQNGKDGIGQEKVLRKLSAVRLKAKGVSAMKNTTLNVEGNISGAIWSINVVVEQGSAVNQFSPPTTVMNPPPPIAGFTYNIADLGQ